MSTMKERVIQILLSAPAQRIRFTFPTSTGRVTIARQSFERVARAIRRGRVKVDAKSSFRSGVGAQYQPGNNTIEVPPVVGRAQEGMVLHECVHALYDIMRIDISALDDEASAYVASSLYFRMTGLRPPRWAAEPHRTAGEVAARLLSEYQRGGGGIPVVAADEWNVLRAVVQTHPVYVFPGAASGDYTLGPAATGGSYTHDG